MRAMSLTDGVVIPTTDDVAYNQSFKDFRWVYNKMVICHTQKIPHGPLGTTPTEYPICVKPIIIYLVVLLVL